MQRFPPTRPCIGTPLVLEKSFFDNLIRITALWRSIRLPIASPIYVVGPDVPTVVGDAMGLPERRLHLSARSPSNGQAVPIPSYAEPATGTDSEMTIYQPSTDMIWEFWKASQNPKEIGQACWGGRMDGRFNKMTGYGLTLSEQRPPGSPS